MFDIEIYNNQELLSKDLWSYTDRINKCYKEMSRNGLKIARLLYEVNDKELFSKDFDSMEEYTLKVFNLKKSSMYNLLKIGELVAVNESGQKYYSIYDTDTESFGYTQLTILSTLPESIVRGLIDDGYVKASLSTRELKKIVSLYKDKDPEADPEDEPNQEDTPEADPEDTEVIESEAVKERDLIFEIYYDADTGEWDLNSYSEDYSDVFKEIEKILKMRNAHLKFLRDMKK